jgi:hypothetical protein
MYKLVRESITQNLKQELIDTILNTLYKNEITEQKEKYRRQLELLPEDELEQILINYNLFLLK